MQSEHDVFDYSTDDPEDGSVAESGDDDDDDDWVPEAGGGQRGGRNASVISSPRGRGSGGAGANGGASSNGGVSRGVSSGKGKLKENGIGGGGNVRER